MRAWLQARVKPVQDAHPENNASEAWCEITGGGRVVLITNYPDDPLVALLGAQAKPRVKTACAPFGKVAVSEYTSPSSPVAVTTRQSSSRPARSRRPIQVWQPKVVGRKALRRALAGPTVPA